MAHQRYSKLDMDITLAAIVFGTVLVLFSRDVFND